MNPVTNPFEAPPAPYRAVSLKQLWLARLRSGLNALRRGLWPLRSLSLR